MHTFAFLSIFLMTSASVTYAAEKPSVFQLTSGEYQPYTSETLPHYGIDNRIVMAAFKSVRIEVKTEFYPWARALKWAKRTNRNACFIIVTRSLKSIRNICIAFSPPSTIGTQSYKIANNCVKKVSALGPHITIGKNSKTKKRTALFRFIE